MPQTRAIKEATVEELTAALKGAESVYFTDLTGLDVERVTKLRSQLHAASVECRVVKNTLTRFAVKNAELPDLGSYLEGPTALVFSQEPVSPAKILVDFGKENDEKPMIKGGLLTGAIIEADQVQELAKLPAREELLAKVVGGIAAPISGLVFSLSGVLGNMVRVLSAIGVQKDSEGGEVQPTPSND